MRTVQLTGILPQSAKRANKFALVVVLVDVTGPVSIADVNIPRRRDGYVGRMVRGHRTVFLRFVAIGFRRITQSKYFLALQGPFRHHAMLIIAKIQELFTAL